MSLATPVWQTNFQVDRVDDRRLEVVADGQLSPACHCHLFLPVAPVHDHRSAETRRRGRWSPQHPRARLGCAAPNDDRRLELIASKWCANGHRHDKCVAAHCNCRSSVAPGQGARVPRADGAAAASWSLWHLKWVGGGPGPGPT